MPRINVTKKVDFPNTLIRNKNQCFPKMPAESSLPQLPFICLSIGSSGAGKTTTALNLLKRYQDNDAFDRIALFSPTGCPDEHTGLAADSRYLDPMYRITDLHPEYTDETLEELMGEQREKIAEFKKFLKIKKMWEKFLETNDQDLALKLYQLMENGTALPPECDMTRYPSSLVIMDDTGDDAKGSRRLNTFVSRIRHCLCSYMGNYQSMTQASRTMRKQCNLWVIFKSSDSKNLRQIYEECCSGDMKFDTFMEMFKQLENKHDFIMVDMRAPPHKKYRINFDTFIQPED